MSLPALRGHLVTKTVGGSGVLTVWTVDGVAIDSGLRSGDRLVGFDRKDSKGMQIGSCFGGVGNPRAVVVPRAGPRPPWRAARRRRCFDGHFAFLLVAADVWHAAAAVDSVVREAARRLLA